MNFRTHEKVIEYSTMFHHHTRANLPKYLSFFSMALPAHSEPRPLIQFRNHFSQTVGLLGPSTSDQLVERPLSNHMTTQTQNKRIHTPNIYALSEIRTHDSSVRAKTFHAIDRAAAVTGYRNLSLSVIKNEAFTQLNAYVIHCDNEALYSPS
jgi:hypothetical protein